MIINIAANAVHAKLIDPPKEARLIVSDSLSYLVDGFEHMAKRPGWDGRSSFYSFKTDSFPAGFIHRVQKRLIKEGYQVRIVKKSLPEPLGPENPVVDEFGFDPRYSYQLESVRKLEKYGQIIAQLATGGGKSRVARLAYARINRKTLFLTTRSALLYQFAKDAKKSFGEKAVGIVGDSQWESDRQLVCGMVQTLAQRLVVNTVDELVERHLNAQSEREIKERDALKTRLLKAKTSAKEIVAQLEELQKRQVAKRISDAALSAKITATIEKQRQQHTETVALLNEFELVIAEEAHEAGGNGYFDVMNACKNAYYRLSLTATPFMRADAESNMRLMAVSGGVAIRVTEKQLIDLGILATPIFNIVPTQRPSKLFRGSPYVKAYEFGIVNHEWRNKRIVAECIRMARYGLTSMILVQRVLHGELIMSTLKRAGLKGLFINGEHEQEEREVALKKLGTGEINVLIGTNILDVGVDVPSVGCIILAGGGKAEVANRQRIGRGLRAKKSGPNICFVLDFADEHNSHLQKHAIQRKEIITSTPGFVENLLPEGSDWKLENYGFKRAV